MILPSICLLTVTGLAWLVVNRGTSFTDITTTFTLYKMKYWDAPVEEGTAEIEFLSPTPLQLFTAGSRVDVEALVRMHGQKIKTIQIIGDGITKPRGPFEEREAIEPELVSSEDGVYRYRYTINNIQNTEIGYKNNVSILVVDTKGRGNLQGTYYFVRKIWPINITSPRDGWTFDRQGLYPDPVYPGQRQRMTQILVEWTPGVPRYSEDNLADTYSLWVDGKLYTEGNNNQFYWHKPIPGTHTFEVVRSVENVEITRSPLVTIHVK
jgi:hypothetical protein